jgi:acetyl esterase/lipase
MAWEAARLAERGYVVMNIDYRLAPSHPFPAQIHDAKSAVYWLRAQASQFQVDPARIGAYGYSAGAHLALLLGVTDPSNGLEGPDATGTGLQSRVQAVVAGGPPSDFRDLPPNSTEFAYWLGGTPAQLPHVYEQASPAYWVTSNDTPTFLFVGARDQLISVPKVHRLAQQLTALGVANDVYVVPNATHLSAARNHVAFLRAGRFLDQTLKG